MKILIIDNYDSFTYNLVQLVGSFNHSIQVCRNDAISLDEINELKPDKIIISPGPGRPEDSKISLEIVKQLSGSIPILGVCLGHQAIALAFGGKIIKTKNLMHGKTSLIKHDNKSIFASIPQDFIATRYHSLIIEKESFPSELEISAFSEDGEIMGIRHKTNPIEGIQFHPESILTLEGRNIVGNWLAL